LKKVRMTFFNILLELRRFPAPRPSS